MPWFRMYTDFLNDPKMITLAFEDQRHFIGLLALKGDGTLDNQCDPDLMNRIIAQRLWIDSAVIKEVKKRLVLAGLIDDDWQPLAWEKRQMRSDSSTERVRNYRAKSKQAGNEAGNDGETLQKRSSNGLETEEDTDKEEKKKTKGARASRRVESTIELPDWLSGEAWGNWVAYRRKGKAPFTDHAASLSIEALDKLRADGHDPVAVINQSVLRGWTGLFPVKDAANPQEQGGATSGAGAIWWETMSGIEAKGAELGVEKRPDWNGRAFMMHVFRAAGPGPWIEAELAKAQKANPNEYERAFAFFHGVSATKLEELRKRGAA
ncbi:hypothetical protein PPN31114_00230 [Pandoraea pneumonica]|uniref:Uncharacterized protein n=2 Tax=Pandoraea pneumonica TaxID=2508299 RepID=A0A5E4RNZ5_9BURK|nr:hypothetical protein PPN31114_00230 [Pandoraea pneumonica]